MKQFIITIVISFIVGVITTLMLFSDSKAESYKALSDNGQLLTYDSTLYYQGVVNADVLEALDVLSGEYVRLDIKFKDGNGTQD